LSGLSLLMGRRIERPGTNVKKGALLRLHQAAALVLAATTLAAVGCGKAAGKERHAQASPAPEAAPPTPDNTPIEALRTPAGLILKTGDAPSGVTPAPPSPTPAPPAS
jgi:hypothetical protein